MNFTSLVVRSLRAAVVFFAALGLTWAGDILVSTSEGGLYRYLSGPPLSFYRSWVAQPTIVKVLPKPDGTKLYCVSSSSTNSILILSPDLSSQVGTAVSLAGASNAWLSPDGSRLIVLAGDLRIFDTTTDTDITPKFGIPVGAITDLAISPDSRTAYAFSGINQSVIAVDLQTFAVGNSVQIGNNQASLSFGPNGLLYAVTSDSIFEIDPATVAVRNKIAYIGTLAPLVFSADGHNAYAINQRGGGVGPVLIYSLDSHVLAGGTGTMGVAYKKIILAGAGQLIGVNSATNAMDVIPAQAGNSSQLVLPGVTTPFTGVIDLATTEEVPNPHYLFALLSNSLVKIDLLNMALSAQAPVATGTPIDEVYSKSIATGSPASVIGLGSGQSVPTGSTAGPIGMRVLNAAGQPLGGVPVAFSAVSGGATVASSSVTTNPDGYAYTAITMPLTVAAYTFKATAGGLSASYTINVTTSSSGGGGAAPGAPSIYSGNGQLVQQGAPSPLPLVVSVKDANGNPMPGVTVTWSIASGLALLRASPVTTTDSNGMAMMNITGAVSMAFGQVIDASVITASTTAGSVSFFFTSFAATFGTQIAGVSIQLLKPTPDVTQITASVGQTLTGAVQASVVAVIGGTPVPNVAIQVDTGMNPASGPTTSCAGGYALTDVTGKASCDVVFGGVPGSALMTIRIGGNPTLQPVPITVTPGAPSQIVPAAGNNTSATPGQQVLLTATIQDAGGNKLTGVSATWALVVAGSGTLSKTTDVSNSQGQISTVVTAGTVSGPLQVRASVGTVTFTFVINVTVPVGSFTKVSGDGQSAKVAANFANPLVVKVLDTNNQPIANAVVSFSITSGVAFLSGTTATTDSTGAASITVQAANTAGPVTIAASFGSSSVTFNLTVLPPGPTVDGFYDVASFQQGVTPGALVRMLGSNLAPDLSGTVYGGSIVGGFPYSLNGISVTFGNIAAPIYAVTNEGGQESVTLQVPFEVPVGQTSVVVTVNGASTTVNNVTVLQYNPGLFMTGRPDGSPYGVVMKQDGSFASPTNPVQRGEILTTFASGLGPVTPATATNAAGIGGQQVQAQVIVGVNHAGMRVISAEYAQNLIGVYAITFELAADTEAGTERPFQIAVRAGDGTVNSNATVIPVIQ